jgi:iron complex transport system substrate-binding protein
MRIVSLLPSATEIVCALGLVDDLVGITHECDWPPEVAGKPVLTRATHAMAGLSGGQIHRLVTAAMHGGSSLYELDEEALAAANPDLILTQELCDVCAVSYRRVNEAVREMGGSATVLSLEPSSIEGIFNTISTVGAMADAEDAAVEVLEDLRSRLGEIEERVQERRSDGQAPLRVAALEWLDPPFAAGHWVPEQVRRAGAWEVLGAEGQRSVESSWEAVRDVDPELLVLMPCGFHVEDSVEEWRRAPRPAFWHDLDAVRRGQVFVVDGSAYFSRPGPRVIDGIAILAEIFDPDGFVEASPIGSWTPVD